MYKLTDQLTSDPAFQLTSKTGRQIYIFQNSFQQTQE